MPRRVGDHPGGPWTWTDPGPLTPGALYAYAARRFSAASGAYSPFSASVLETGPVPLTAPFTLFLSALDQPGLTFYDPGA